LNYIYLKYALLSAASPFILDFLPIDGLEVRVFELELYDTTL